MGDMEDDFGELYADVEMQVSSAISENPSFNKLHIEEEKKSVCLGSEEIKGWNGDLSVIESKTVVKEEKEEVRVDVDVENGSEREDDLHIVLNEDDCPAGEKRVPYSVNVGNGVEGSEEEEGDLILVAEGDDRKRVDQDGLEQSCGGGERGNLVKGGYGSSQYKYTRPDKASYASNTKMNGYGTSVSSPSPFKGDWDVNGCSQQMGSDSGSVASFRNSFSGTAPSGCDFFLPRHRTIFDVNIEMFENKPWRHPGVDTTDFFNFGFDEESWKQYWNHMEHYRQQAYTGIKIPVYRSSMSNQAYEEEYGHQTMESEAVAGEIAPNEHGESVSSEMNAMRGAKPLKIPKGRRIQVEGSIAERRSSMDMRRPRTRDSDVVIQIAVQDSNESSSVSSKEEPGHLDNPKLDVPENGCSCDGDEHFMETKDRRHRNFRTCTVKKFEVRRVKNYEVCCLPRRSRLKTLSDTLLDPDSQGEKQIHALDGCLDEGGNKHVSEETSEAVDIAEDIKEVDNKNSLRVDCSRLKTESSLENQIQPSSSPSNPDSPVDASKAEIARRASSNSDTEEQIPVKLDYHGLKESGRSHGKTDLQDSKDDKGNPSCVKNGEDYGSRVRLHCVAELKVHAGDDRASLRSTRKDWCDGTRLTRSHKKRKERKNDYDFYYGEDSAHYRETEVSVGYSSGRFAEEPLRDAYINDFHGKDHVNCKDETDPYLSRHQDEREYFVERSLTVRDNEINRSEHYINEGYGTRRMSGVSHRESTHLMSEYFYTDRERRHGHRRRRNDEHWLIRGSEDDDFVLEQKHREEYMESNCDRYNRETEHYKERCERSVAYRNSDRRDRYGGSPPLDMLNASRRSAIHDEYGEYPEHESFISTPRDFHVVNKRWWNGTTSPRNTVNGSRRSDASHWRHRHSDKHKHKHKGWFDPNWERNHTSDEVLYPDDDRRTHTRQSKALEWREDELHSRYRDRNRMFSDETFISYEPNSRHEGINPKHDPSHGQIVFDEYRPERKRTRREVSGSFVDNTKIISNFDTIEKDKDEQADLRSKESADLHLSCEGKASGRYSKAAGARYCMDIVECVIDKDHKTSKLSDKVQAQKIAVRDIPEVETNETLFGKEPFMQRHETSTLEEGQLPEEGEIKEPEGNWYYEKIGGEIKEPEINLCEKIEEGEIKLETNQCFEKTINQCYEKTTILDGVKKENKTSSQEAVNVVGGYDNNRILATLAKMEKRRERFKEPIELKEPEKNGKPQPPMADITVETTSTEVNQHRPARKRRWGGS